MLGSSEEAQDHWKLESDSKRRSNWKFAALVAANRVMCTTRVTAMGVVVPPPLYLEAGYSGSITGQGTAPGVAVPPPFISREGCLGGLVTTPRVAVPPP